MSGFKGFLDIKLPPLNNDEFNESEFNTIKQLEMFSNLKKDDLPIEIGSKSLPINQMLSDLLDEQLNPKRYIAEKISQILVRAPDSIVSFADVNIDETPALTRFPSFLAKTVQRNPQYYQSLIKLLIQFFLRIPKDQFILPSAQKTINAIAQFTKDPIFNQAIQLRVLIGQLEYNLVQSSYSSHVLLPISNLLLSLYNSPLADAVLPWLCGPLALVLSEIAAAVFTNTSYNSGERLQCTILIPQIAVTIAAVYPPALLNMDWKPLASNFSTRSKILRNLEPDHNFQINFPGLTYHYQTVDNIVALLFSFSYFAQLNEKSPNNDIYLSVLLSLSNQSRIGQTACARSLYTMTKYRAFQSYAKCFTKLCLGNEVYAAILYVSMLRDFYDYFVVQVEREFNLASQIAQRTTIPEISVPAEQISCLNTPHVSPDDDLFTLVRSVDGFLHGKAADISEFFRTGPSPFQTISSFITCNLRSGACLLDFRKNIPFAHLCVSYIKLILKIRPVSQKDDKLPSCLNPLFVLLIFDHILAMGQPKTSLQRDFNSHTAQLYQERIRLAKGIVNVAPKFFPVAVQFCIHKSPSLIFALLVLLSDVLSLYFVPICNPGQVPLPDPSYLQKFDTQLSKWILCFLRSESQYVYDEMFELLFSLIKITTIRHSVFTLPVIHLIKESYITFQEDRKKRTSFFNRVLSLFLKLVSQPVPKAAFISLDQTREVVGILIKCLAADFAEKYPETTCVACDCICCLGSSIISPIMHNKPIAMIIDTLDYDFLEPVVNSFSKLLQNANTLSNDLIHRVLMAANELSQNVYWMDCFRSLKFRFTYDYIINSEILKKDSTIIGYAFSIAVNFAHFDVQYAKEFIGYDQSKDQFDDSLNIINRLLSIIEFPDDKPPVYPDDTLENLQRSEQFYDKQAWFKKKINSMIEEKPIIIPLSHLTQISSSNFMSEILVKATKQ